MKKMFLLGIACVLMAACATQTTVQQPKYSSAEESMAAKGLQSIDTAISKMNAFKTAAESGFLKDMTGTNTFNWNGRNISQSEAMSKFFMWKEWIPKMETARAKLSADLNQFSKDRTSELNKTELNKTLIEVDALLKEYNRQAD
jgi:outer membrane biogenesis lipoprotein LolB